jgi:PadR family transcriptional regulator, regulatory protein AphA
MMRDIVPLTPNRTCSISIYIKSTYIGLEFSVNVRTLCLGYLSLREATGYEMKKDFEEGLFCHFMEASYGSIYPALGQLAAEGLVTVREEEQSGKPDKKVYAITPEGTRQLSKSLAVVPAQDKFKSEFLFIMLLQHHITPQQRLAAMQTQLAFTRQDLGNIAQCRCEMGGNAASEFVMGYGEAILTAGVKYLEQKLQEMEQVQPIAAE